MDKEIWKFTGEYPYFLGNILVGFRIVFLPNCLLILSILKHTNVGAFLNPKKKKKSQTGEAP